MEMFIAFYNLYISNILDIFILTLIFYRIILIIQGTRTIQIFVGILFILGLTVVSRDILHLKALSWLLDNFWLAAVIIFAVIFQTEIRNLLAQVGGHLWGSKSKIKDSYVIEIIDAVEDLSSSMVGVLIAIENEIGLKNFTETGVLLNADISRELLLSIFKNKSAPLHDGAIIVSNARIISAGCVLPLSHDTNVKLFGTRHRAALGLSEVTDAVVVVVSEETGQISVAHDSKLHGNISLSKLREIINTNGEVLRTK
ncbi:MAG: diadenylate cyclase CdaA [Endomicrobium sp.]|jgi:diadenylate cyclase|nr:diadenylate cyclase CdaA [Endomicrobium sp.]